MMDDLLEEITKERDEIAAAADRNAAKLTRLARLNREYLEQNKKLGDENKQLKEKVQALIEQLAKKTTQLEESKKPVDDAGLNHQIGEVSFAGSHTSFLEDVAAANKDEINLKSSNEAETKRLDDMRKVNAKVEKYGGQIKDEKLRSDDKIKALTYAVTHLTSQVETLTSKNQDVEAQLASSKTLADQLKVQLSMQNEEMEVDEGKEFFLEPVYERYLPRVHLTKPFRTNSKRANDS